MPRAGKAGALFACLLLACSATAGTFTAFGPQTYQRGTGDPVTVRNSFSVRNPSTQYTIRVRNGGLVDGEFEKVSSSIIALNGAQVLGPEEFNQNVAVVEKAVVLQASNELAVEVRGKPGGAISLEIIGVDNDPPTITATVTPAPNANGWNNSDVTVSFACDDMTSGVATCPAPVAVSTEGANQLISGTATDKAGNTATASATVNLDKTRPVITATPLPAPNAAGWNKSDVTVTFTCSDALSGVAVCPEPVLVSTEGGNQVVSGTVSDRAGNTASATATIKLDKTAPTVTITSPANNATLSSTSATVTGTASDSLSGIASVTCNGAAATLSGSDFTCNLTLTTGSNTITVKATDVAGNEQTASITATVGGLRITDFNPKSAPAGSLVTITGSDLVSSSGGPGPQVTLNKQGGGTISAPVASASATSIAFVIPTGAATGSITVTLGTQSAVSATPLTIVPSTGFTLSAAPATAEIIQGQSVAYAVALSSTNGFAQLATLSVSGLPAGLTASFKPQQITAGQTSLLTVTASSTQQPTAATLSVSASANVEGIAFAQSVNVTVNVRTVTTSFLGRTVVADALQTALAGVTVTLLGKDGNGSPTGCTGQTRSDAAGNFGFTNLPSNCTGGQLIRYDGTTATSPSGRYAGVDLFYNIAAGQVTVSPVLIHLPRIDNAETVMVQQNFPVDQTFTFSTIPNLSVTVYAGTVFTLVDGTRPNPFPLVAIEVAVDRLPDEMPPSTSTVAAFIVAFQPANATASQPVAVSFPNRLNTPPGANMQLSTLDPTKGVMVVYGTGTVSTNGTQVVPDFNPATPGRRFGLVNFDWHGPVQPPNPANPSPDVCRVSFGKPLDLASGLEVFTETDIEIEGGRGRISVDRTYRTLSTAAGPFGIGTNHNYGYRLDTFAPQSGAVVNLIMPDGNRFPFSRQADGTLINTTIPSMLGAVLTTFSDGRASLRWKDGTAFQFIPANATLGSVLSSISSSNGNTIGITRAPNNLVRITLITDPVGRTLNLSYDATDRIASIVDPIGRTVLYGYNAQGTLATVTNPAGGVTHYDYDAQNRMIRVTDARGVVVAQNTYDVNGRVVQQIQADGGMIRFAYTLLNPAVPTSPVQQTVVTDPLGHQTIYRFSPQGFLISVTDASGQVRAFERAPGTNLVLAIRGSATCRVCGSSGQGDELFAYDANGNLSTTADVLGNTTSFTYDPVFHKVASVRDPFGNVTNFAYDSRGNALSRTDANGRKASLSYDASGLPTEFTDPLGRRTVFSYDSAGNLISGTDALGNTTSTGYDAISRAIQTIDALGRKSSIAYDRLDRIVSQTDANGGTTAFQYDAVGNLLAVTDAKGNRTSFTYDLMNRVITRTTPLGRIDTRGYDPDGNVIVFTDRRGQTSSFTYDVLHRLVRETYQDGAIVTRIYDSQGRLVQANDSSSGSFTFAFDPAGRLTSTANTLGSVVYFNDAMGRVISRQVVGQPAVSHTYDSAGSLLTATAPQVSVSFAYDELNQVTRVVRSNGVSTTYTYDELGRVLSITHSSGGITLNSQVYAYDALGNRVSNTTNVAQSLISQATNSTYDAENHLLQSGATTYTYDANGNRVSHSNLAGNTNYTWDSRNRLQSLFTPDGKTTTFTYDFESNLILETSGGGSSSRTFVLDNLTNVIYQTVQGTGSSILTTRSIDQHLAVLEAGQSIFGLVDALNSTATVVNQGGSAIGKFFYEPYGQTTASGLGYPFLYTGRVPVAGGLYYYRTRYYDPLAGRFITEDPLGFDAGVNFFAYVGSNPVNWTDPFGLQNFPPPPPNIPGGPWTWSRDAENPRGGTYRDPRGQVASWESGRSHWDVDNGRGVRQRYDVWGNPLTRQQAHSYRGPRQRPIDFSRRGPRPRVGPRCLGWLSLIMILFDAWEYGQEREYCRKNPCACPGWPCSF